MVSIHELESQIQVASFISAHKMRLFRFLGNTGKRKQKRIQFCLDRVYFRESIWKTRESLRSDQAWAIGATGRSPIVEDGFKPQNMFLRNGCQSFDWVGAHVTQLLFLISNQQRRI
jgi:hypothetical protein